ncbi:MAG TPA: hypothetical protein PKA88_31870, partial [Polyangiaceae bacterium]|nr:hypothetical protein [Polyangiaceae bacterium]
MDALFARALAVEPKDRPEGLLNWWNELKAAAVGAAPSIRPPPPPAHPGPPSPPSSPVAQPVEP